MSNHTQRTWTKTDSEDAARLLQELAQRAEKASGGLKRPEQIQNPADVPRKLGHGASEESAKGFGAHHPRKLPAGQTGERVTGTDAGESVPVISATGEDGRRWGVANNDNYAGGVMASEAVGGCGDAPARADQRRFVTPLFTGPGSFSKTDTARW